MISEIAVVVNDRMKIGNPIGAVEDATRWLVVMTTHRVVMMLSVASVGKDLVERDSRSGKSLITRKGTRW